MSVSSGRTCAPSISGMYTYSPASRRTRSSFQLHSSVAEVYTPDPDTRVEEQKGTSIVVSDISPSRQKLCVAKAEPEV